MPIILLLDTFRNRGLPKRSVFPSLRGWGISRIMRVEQLCNAPCFPKIRYLESGRLLQKQKETVLAKIRALSKSHIVHDSPQQWANGNATTLPPIDPLSVPAIRETGWSPAMDELARAPRRGPHFNEFRLFLYQIQNHNQAWPFQEPVDKDEVPDYYNAIISPMDLSAMEERLEQGVYNTPKEFVEDFKLIFVNCRKYNDATTVYAKCAVKLEKYMWSLIRRYS